MPPQTLAKKARTLFYLNVSIGIFLLLTIGILGAKIYTYTHIVMRSLRGEMISSCDCAGLISLLGDPWRFLPAAGVALVIVGFTVWAFLRSSSLWFKTRAFVRARLKNQKTLFSPKLTLVLSYVPLHQKYMREIKSDEPWVFCFGLLRPTICISSSLIERLTNEELIAVLRHEDLHRKLYEPLRLFVMACIRRIFCFVPGIAALQEQYSTASELLADEEATNGFVQRKPLARALAKVMDLQEQRLVQRLSTLSFFGPVTEERVKLLTGEKPRSFSLLTVRTLVGVVLIMVVFIGMYLVLFFWSPVSAQNKKEFCSAAASTLPGTCRLTEDAWVCALGTGTDFCSPQEL